MCATRRGRDVVKTEKYRSLVDGIDKTFDPRFTRELAEVSVEKPMLKE